MPKIIFEKIFVIAALCPIAAIATTIENTNNNLKLHPSAHEKNLPKLSIDNSPILLIGASYVNEKIRIDDNGSAPLGGGSVGSGSYFALGTALLKSPLFIQNNVINEGMVGATTFDRFSCAQTSCLSGGKLFGYSTQLQNALRRVAYLDSNGTVKYNAKFAIIDFPNDCIHSDAKGLPQNLSQQCTANDIQQTIDNVIHVANMALQNNIIPLISAPPKIEDLDLAVLKQDLTYNWVISNEAYNAYRNIYVQQITSQLGGKYMTNIWSDFKHRGDGIHPDNRTVILATLKIKNKMRQFP